MNVQRTGKREPETPLEPAPFPVVGVGGSAGALVALKELFRALPDTTGMAWVVIMHLSPDHKSVLAELLQQATRMPVTQVRATVPLEADHVYVIPPSHSLIMEDGALALTPLRRKDGRHVAIDTFFRTLARARTTRAFAVLLSGAGSDGTTGLRWIKDNGGVTLVQDPSEAEYDPMPRTAIATGMADFVLPAGALGPKVLDLWANARKIEMPPSASAISEDPGAQAILREILALLRHRSGHDFSSYKPATVLRRIERRLQVNQLPDLRAYRDYFRGHPNETASLLKDMLISVTHFYRDAAAFRAVEQQVIPRLLEVEPDELRVWVPGCATGEEAYSIAILLDEAVARLEDSPDVQVFATDIDEGALAVARAGFYPLSIAGEVPPARLRKHFHREPHGYRVQKHIRDRVMFAPHSVLKDPPFSRIDFVSCRNLLIYLDRAAQARVIDLLHFALAPDGFLLLGGSESIDDVQQGFAVFDKEHRLFRKMQRPLRGYVLPATRTHALAPAGPPPARAEPLAPMSTTRDLHLALLALHAPPSLVVNEQYDIVHVSEQVSPYLKFPPGAPSTNLLRCVDPDIRVELRALLFQSMHSMQPTSASGLRFVRDGRSIELSLRVHPTRDASSGAVHALVVFEEIASAGGDVAPERPSLDPLVRQLERQLDDTRDRLRTTVEQYEAQNEELRASNEELQAINEELRSTTEELETSREELQSINEELTTVNQELKEKMDETNSANNDLQNFIASSDVGLVFLDREQRLLRYTPPVLDILNVRATDLGRSVFDVTHRLDYDDFQDDVRGVLDNLAPVEREVRSDAGRWYSVHILPYRTADDRIEGTVVTFIDISPLKSAEHRWQRGEERLRRIFESILDYAIISLDLGGVITGWNTGAEALFGYGSDEITGQSWRTLFTPEDLASEVPETELRAAFTTGRGVDDRWLLRKDGSRVFVSGGTVPLRETEVYGYVKIVRDMTELRGLVAERDRLLAAERAQRAVAEEQGRLKDAFLATVSHEMRNPLNTIKLQAELLLAGKDATVSDEVRQAIQVMHQMTTTQARLVDDLLDIARLRNGKMGVRAQLLPVALMAGDCIGAVAQDISSKQITLVTDFTSEPLVVAADPMRLRQVIWNLLNNAVKFTPVGGKVIVRVTREDDSARIDVEDNGIGITPEELPRIFDIFAQGLSTFSRDHGGLGIGLAIARQLVELQGGRLEGYSEGRGKGARFTVRLPLQRESVDVARPGASAVVRGPKRLAGTVVAVIDDAPSTAEMLSQLLALEEAQTLAFDDPEKALRELAEQPADVVLSDLAMPKVDGFAFFAQLRALPLHRDTPVIAMSGFGRQQDLDEARAAGFADYLVKPIELERLVDTIVKFAPRPSTGG